MTNIAATSTLKPSPDKVAELEPDNSSLVASQFEAPDYQDRFSIAIGTEQYKTVDEVVTDWFKKQPGWLRAVSTNTLSKRKVLDALTDKRYEVGHNVGSWEVFARDDEEIVFGDHMGFMDYRFSFRLVDGKPSTVEGATSVEFLWNRSAGFYFGCVRPFHRRFVKLALVTTTTSSLSDANQMTQNDTHPKQFPELPSNQ